MKKLSLFVIPLGILCSGITLAPRPEPVPQVDLRHLAGNMTVLRLEAPANLDFATDRVPVDVMHVKDKLDRELKRHQYYYAGNLLVHKRAARYQATFQQILREHGVPEDFFYLAIAESNLSNATSPVGAKGFWQFMKPTAKAYGLEVSATVDERYHPEKATHAAARYLLEAYDRFEDWALVAASYNMGQYGLARQMKRQGVCNYYDLKLNRETSRYVYRILTYKMILEQPQRFDLDLGDAELYAPITYRAVWVREDIPSLAAFADAQGSSYERLKQLNPWLIADRLTVKPGKAYEIRIPVTKEYIAVELEPDPVRIQLPETMESPLDTLMPLDQVADEVEPQQDSLKHQVAEPTALPAEDRA